MVCRNCNGRLIFQNGVYICESCGNVQQVNSEFLNNEVFIAYVENDEYGRRTKDSIIAQEIFRKLQSNNISCFYERISIENLPISDRDTEIDIAINSSKIIILVSSSVENFQKLLAMYYTKLNNKIIIPIYSQINAYDLPKEIANLQALNYDNIGTMVDLTNGILTKLGKTQEVDVITDSKKQKTTTKKVISLTLISILLILIGSSIYVVFGTYYVLDSKKYQYAQKLESNGDYMGAIKVYSGISNYRDTINKINAIYNKYNGHFYNEDEKATLYLNIDSNLNAKIEVTKICGEKHISFDGESKVIQNTIMFNFKDSQEGRGKCTINLGNNGLELKISAMEESQLLYDNLDCEYRFDDRIDGSQANSVSPIDLLNYMDNKLTLQDIHDMGVKTDYIGGMSSDIYRIQNTDYGIRFSNNSKSSSIIGIYAPFEELFPDAELCYLPTIIDDKAYIPCSISYGLYNLYEEGYYDDVFLKTTYYVTSEEAASDDWEEIQYCIESFNNYNYSDGIKYLLKDGDLTLGYYDNLIDVINDANEKKDKCRNCFVEDISENIIYRP